MNTNFSRFLFIFTLLAFCLSSELLLARSSLHGKIEASDKVSIGDYFYADIMFWPLDNLTQWPVKNHFEGRKILDHFFVVSVSKIEFSLNNADVVIIRALMILLKKLDLKKRLWLKYNEQIIPFFVDGLSIVDKNVKEPTSYKLWTKNSKIIRNKNNRYFLYIFSILSVVLLLIFSYLIVMKKRKKDHLINPILIHPSSRDDFESIYNSEVNWNKLIKNFDVNKNIFFKTVKIYQYKKEWSEEDLKFVSKNFQEIKNKIKVKHGKISNYFRNSVFNILGN